MTDKQLHLELLFTDSYMPLTDTVEKSALLQLSAEQIRSGIISQLSQSNQGGRNFTVLLAIAAHMNADNKAFPSQAKLAEITGYSRPTVATAIKELEKIEIAGKQIIERVKVPSTAGHFKTVYKFSAATVEAEVEQVSDSGSEQVEQKALNAKDVLLLFMKYYEETFGKQYVPAWGREQKQIKDKLIGHFTDDDLKAVVKVAVTEYSERWGSKDYALPTIGQLTSWLANKAMAVVVQQRKDSEQMQEKIETAEQYEQIDTLALLDNL